MDTLFPKRHVPYPRTGNQHLLAAICLFLLQPLLTQNRGTQFRWTQKKDPKGSNMPDAAADA